MDDTNSIPDPSSTPRADGLGETPAPASEGARGRVGNRAFLRALLLAGGAVLAAVVLAGGGVAVGAAIADDDDDRGSSATDTDDDGDSTTGGTQERDDDDADDATPADLTGVGTDSADELTAFTDAASAAADGEAVAIELKADGSADVTLETGDGAETEVRVTAGGETSVTSSDPADADDTAPRSVLDAASIEAIVTAALAEADGRILEIEADEDGASPYEVTVITGAGQLVEIALDSSMAVVGSSSAGTDD
ncbi:hypothetical protein ABZ477_17635 [Microbacterium sp. NPDC019599]|uniref:PepSY domain-containing protein n=1 Tax=Microbacterium sp. NPDC019599 TaxID=3154690 RepID=UPI0033F4D728